ncbi:hypothetical protein GCM10022235_50260 [Kribbella ginsengisoli]|uniref:Septum formation-related domain-containing protein n=1 Tax=Kribbella ginsengisoli TaxID=363865 RepID=A0ABP6Y063_9ACTN
MTNGTPRRGAAVFRHLDKFIENRVLKAAVALAEVAGLVTLVVTGVSAAVHWVAGDEPPGQSSSSSTTPVSTPTPTETSPGTPRLSTPTAAGTTPADGPRCWTVARVVIDCRETHRYEEIPTTAACDQAAVVGYLGGLATLDVLVAHAAVVPGGGCSVDPGRDLSGSAKDVLRSGTAAAWRRCYDGAVHKNVACSVPHTGEYLATGSLRRASDDECQLAALAYLDQTPGNLSDDLVVRPLDVKTGTPDSARCSIDARGNHQLTGSVRSLGPRPVPLAS